MDIKKFEAVLLEVGLTEDELYAWLTEGKRKAQVAQIDAEIRTFVDQKEAEKQAILLAEPIKREEPVEGVIIK
jgi:hypothetical protein